MMRRLILAAAVLMASGCATPDPAIQNRLEATVPKCRDTKECEIKWAAARTFILNNIDMKIQTYSADYIETFNSPASSAFLAASVTKNPQQDGSYKILGKIWCNNMFGCVKEPAKSLQAFNNYVNDSYKAPTP